MESCSMHSSTLTTVSPSLSRAGLVVKPLLRFQVLKFHNAKGRYPRGGNLRFLSVRAQSSGTRNISSDVVEAAANKANPKDENIAFVAGATGKVGSRTVRELLKLGFKVRAGVRSAQRAETLVQSVKQMKPDVEGPQPVEKLEIVECDLEKPDQIGAAIGNASVVLCCVGASEKEIFDISRPYRIDYQATKNLIDAATVARVKHFILVTSLGTNKFGFPAAILNLFWGVLCWKRKAEEALISSGVPYTIVRPGGMERPTDAYKETHNVTLSLEDTLFGGQVSNLQVAELLAVMAKNRLLSYCKVVEVIAETTAPLTPMEELLTKIPYQRTPPKEPNVAAPDPAPSDSAISEAVSTPIEKEPPVVEAKESTPESAISEVVSTPIEEEPPVVKAKESTPLSPYVAYEDLKPPSSPSPTPSTTPHTTKTTSDAEPLAEASISPPATDQVDLSEPVSTVTENVVVETEAKKTRPLSPYIFYEDLKPPSSPMPTAPTGEKKIVNVADAVSMPAPSDDEISTLEITSDVTETAPSDVEISTSEITSDVTETISIPEEAQKARPLSPYAAYEDLKPPTSPRPTPSGPKEKPLPISTLEDIVLPSAQDNDLAKSVTTDSVENDPPPKSTYYLSPYHAYDDLKPPTSPSPSAPNLSQPSTPVVDSEELVTSGNGTAELPPVDEPSDEQHHAEAKPRPLSPFTMYEDMKPPTSPIPSPRN